MKADQFKLHRPTSVKEAVELLAKYCAEDGRILAGGQTLVPTVMFRMATPAHLIDINEITEISEVSVLHDHIHVGAGVRHARFEQLIEPGVTGKLFNTVVQYIAHRPIRARGTLCGSLAQADPSSEWCLTSVVLGAIVFLESKSGKREVPIEAFFEGLMQTCVGSEEMIVGVKFPLLHPDAVFGFAEFSRRKGDYAMAMALTTWRLNNGAIVDARIGIGGAEPNPRRITAAEDRLNGSKPTPELFAEVAEICAESVDPIEDYQVDGQFRRELVRAMTARAMDMCAK